MGITDKKEEVIANRNRNRNLILETVNSTLSE